MKLFWTALKSARRGILKLPLLDFINYDILSDKLFFTRKIFFIQLKRPPPKKKHPLNMSYLRLICTEYFSFYFK